MEATPTTPTTEAANTRGQIIARLTIMIGITLAFMLVFTPAVQAAGGVPDPNELGKSALEFLSKVWVFVILAEIVAALTYAAAFFTQSWLPSFYQAFQGDWLKKAVIIGFAAHPVMGVLYELAKEAAEKGFVAGS